jgi:hypothetical protein
MHLWLIFTPFGQALYAYPTSDLLAVLHQVAQQKAPMERKVTPT